jgi:hypothetical protein
VNYQDWVASSNPVEAIGVIERELLLASTPRSSARRCSRWQTEVFEDLERYALIFNYAYQPHRPGTSRTGEHIERVRAAHEDRPLEPSLAVGVVGAYNVVGSRMNRSSAICPLARTRSPYATDCEEGPSVFGASLLKIVSILDSSFIVSSIFASATVTATSLGQDWSAEK